MASAAELQEGKRWYADANLICCRIAADTNTPIPTVAAVMAALSPQNPWERNCSDAEALIRLYKADGKDAAESYKVGTFGINKRKAIACLQEVSRDGHLKILNGLKVQAFYLSILGDTDAVCVDGHAYSIWLGERVSTTDTPKITPKLYETIADDYRKCAAKIREITGEYLYPAQIQAITWVVHRNLYKGQRKRRTIKG
jgi:hypothetical protein